jgi:hypothetical protein
MQLMETNDSNNGEATLLEMKTGGRLQEESNKECVNGI